MRKKLEIRDQQIKHMIIDVAESLDTDYDESPHEYCVRIPKTLGSGYMRAFQFDSGIGVFEANCLLKKEFDIALKEETINPLKMIFNRGADFHHGFAKDKELHKIRRLENAMVASAPTNNHVFKIPARMPITIFSLEINRKLFEEKIEAFVPKMNQDLITLFRDVNGINPFYYKNYYSLEISEFIEEFIQCELTGFMRQVYLEGKTYEILTNQLQQYLDDINTPDKRVILRKATTERIEESIAIIEEEIESMDNIVELAKRVGLNQNTLQNGFKQLYKTSVNEYIRNFRIEKAKDLLESSDLNITEITYKIGINSRSYFAKLFRKRFGVNPKQYLDKVRGKKGTSKSA